MKKLILGILAALCLASPAFAQTAGVVTASVSPVRQTESATPTVTWSTSPVAIGCSISYGSNVVSGLAASGSRTMPSITDSTDYVVNCTWSGGTGSALVSWTAPTQNTDNTPLTNLASYKILYGASSTSLTQTQVVPDPLATSALVPGLANGTWAFAVRAVNSANVESNNSNVPTLAIAVSAVSASKTVSVVIDKKPKPPGGVTVTVPIAYNVKVDYGRFAFYRGTKAGSVKLGAACDETRVTVDGFTVISRPRSVVTPQPDYGVVLVAKCG